MRGRVAVAKMHGARNDFVVLDARRHTVDDLSAFALAVCDRHAGIGADGVLAIGSSDRAAVSMRVVNPDGSEAEMCGNGVRCVARYLDERGEGGEFEIETLAGLIRTSVVERGEVYRVRVNMGTPHIESIDGAEAPSAIVETGNRHVVRSRDGLDASDLLARGEATKGDARYPGGINVHLATVIDRHTLRVRHYERGAGLTMACGTGAVACASAAIARGEARSPVTVHVPGGELTIEWERGGDAFMTGPAEHVFDTTVAV